MQQISSASLFHKGGRISSCFERAGEDRGRENYLQNQINFRAMAKKRATLRCKVRKEKHLFGFEPGFKISFASLAGFA
jgi:hypothetical protein